MDELKQWGRLIPLVAVFCASLAICQVLAAKIIHFGPFIVPAGVIAYSVTFLMTDTIEEIWGKEVAKRVVLAGFGAMVVMFFLILVAVYWPYPKFWGNQEAFKSVLGMGKGALRITVASMVAYLISQYHDVWIFDFWRKLTKGKHLWLRNNASTIQSQLIDSVIFILLAFTGVMPVLGLIIGQWVAKIVIALVDTPLVYGLVKWVGPRVAKS